MRRKYVSKLKFIVAICLGAIYVLSQLPVAFYGWMGAALILAFFCWGIFRLFVKSEKYIDSRGYVVLRKVNELEHRYIAKHLLKRELAQNEVVHHINGKKTDNQIENLCLMDREKHEHFHAWLMWRNKKSGRYPTIRDQKRILENDYDGLLLENIRDLRSDRYFETPRPENQSGNESRQRLVATLDSKVVDSMPSQGTEKGDHQGSTQKHLFEELRNLRKQIAEEKNIPVYMVFDNRTLTEMSEEMPETESDIMEIWGVGPVKFQMYGEQFLAVIKKSKQSRKRA